MISCKAHLGTFWRMRYIHNTLLLLLFKVLFSGVSSLFVHASCHGKEQSCMITSSTFYQAVHMTIYNVFFFAFVFERLYKTTLVTCELMTYANAIQYAFFFFFFFLFQEKSSDVHCPLN